MTKDEILEIAELEKEQYTEQYEEGNISMSELENTLADIDRKVAAKLANL